jgi:hypothetical protein
MWLWRYWLSIALALLIVVSVGSYYIEADSSKPDFVLVKRMGDEKEAAGVRLSGQFGQNGPDGAVSIGTAGSEYRSDRFLAARLDPYWGYGQFRRVIAEHRNFMRGKQNWSELYEDGSVLAYADVREVGAGAAARSYKLAVSWLDKATNRTSSFEVGLPTSAAYKQVRVADVQVFGDQLKIVTRNYRTSDENAEIHLYSLALKDGSVLSDKKLLLEEGDVLVRGPYEEEWFRSSRYAVFLVGQLRQVPGGRKDYSAEETGRQLALFDLQTGEQVKIVSAEIADLLDSTSEPIDLNISLQGDKLYAAKKIESGAREIMYDIATAKTSVHDVQTDPVRFMTLGGGRLYMLTDPHADKKELPSLVVADAAAGKLLYEGTVAVKGSEQDSAAALSKLTIFNMLVQ